MSPKRFSALVLGIACLCGPSAGADPRPASRPVLIVAVHGDRLTGRIERVPLRQVLAELRRKAHIDGQLIDPADDGLISETFQDLPLAEAMSRLLDGRAFMIYQNQQQAPPVQPRRGVETGGTQPTREVRP